MITKKIAFLWFIWVLAMGWFFFQNYPLPLWFDHGAYKHFINLLSENQSITKMPEYLQYQFEPFSGTFFYTLTQFLGKDILFTWWYLIIFIGISLALFLLGKRKNRYTIGSYLGLFLFFFSVLQYSPFLWSFWKQMFAVFFFVLLIRYHKNIPIMIMLVAACIWIHRLTGFVAILFLSITFLLKYKKYPKVFLPFLIWIIIGSLTYIDTFSYQIKPLIVSLTQHFSRYIWVPGQYGTGLTPWAFWFYQIPLLFMILLGATSYFSDKKKGDLLKMPQFITAVIIGGMVLFRSIAHTRLWPFFDLFLIVLITQIFYSSFHKIWIYIFLIIHMTTWWVWAYQSHTPFIAEKEYQTIRAIARDMPDNGNLVTLTGAYMSWMSDVFDREIYSLYQGVSSKVWSKKDRKQMKYDKEFLCKNLRKIPWDVFVYLWSKEIFTSPLDNPCLEIVHKWSHGGQFFHYTWSEK